MTDDLIEKLGRKHPRRVENSFETAKNIEWWGKKKPKPEDPKKDDDVDDEKDNFEMRRKQMINDFYKRKQKRFKNSPPSTGRNWQSDFKIMKNRIKPNYDDSELLLNIIRSEEKQDESEGSFSMNMRRDPRTLRSQSDYESNYDEGDEPDFKVPVKTGDGIFCRMKKRIKKAFNSSFKDPIARLFVAMALGLITTLSVYAVISLVKTMIVKRGEIINESRMREYGHASYQYSPIPQPSA